MIRMIIILAANPPKSPQTGRGGPCEGYTGPVRWNRGHVMAAPGY